MPLRHCRPCRWSPMRCRSGNPFRPLCDTSMPRRPRRGQRHVELSCARAVPEAATAEVLVRGNSMNAKPAQLQQRQPGLQSEMRPDPQVKPRFPGSGRLAGKTAIVTGGDSGIGQAVAVLFAREGANVAILYLDETYDARKAARMVRDEGGECLAIAGDVGEEQFCRKAVERVVAQFGGVDVLVNNAAEQHPKEDITEISR